MEGIFHWGNALGGFADNRVKSIQTRSGHRIVFTEDESVIITDKSGNEIHLDTTGSNINITAPETMTLNCKNMNINVGENMTTSVGLNVTESIGMSSSQSIGMNSTQSVGAMKMTSVVGDASMFITGKLMEVIEGDAHSATKQGKTVVNSEGGIETSTSGQIKKDTCGNFVMGRLIIVKSKKFEKIRGNLQYYSNADNTEKASKIYAEQVKPESYMKKSE